MSSREPDYYLTFVLLTAVVQRIFSYNLQHVYLASKYHNKRISGMEWLKNSCKDWDLIYTQACYL